MGRKRTRTAKLIIVLSILFLTPSVLGGVTFSGSALLSVLVPASFAPL